MKIKYILLTLLCFTGLVGCVSSDNETDGNKEPEVVEPIVYEDIKIYVDDDKDLKVMQMTDTHFGNEDYPSHNGKVDLTLQFMNYLVEVGTPDFIVATGDQMMNTGIKGAQEFIDIMEEFKVPWTWVFGNHDMESPAQKTMVAEYLYEQSLECEYFIYTEDYIDTEAYRYGNFIMEVYNKQSGTLRGGIVCLDTGVNDRINGGYEALTQGQVDWYVEAIEELDEKYEGEGVVPTILFQHMHTPVFYDGYLNAVEYKKNPDTQDEYKGEFVIDQFLSSLNIVAIKEQGNKDDLGMFEEIVRLGSTKAIFVGHTHYHRLQYTYEGILLGFGPQTGYANDFYGDSLERHTYQYHLSPNFDIVTEDIVQPTLYVSDKEVEVFVGEEFELNYSLNDIEGEVIVTTNNGNISIIEKPNAIIITGVVQGEVEIEFTAPYELSYTTTIIVNEVMNYNLYDETDTLILSTTSLYEAIDEMYVLNLAEGSHIKDVKTENIVYQMNTSQYAVVNKQGITNVFDYNTNITNGYADRVDNLVEELNLYTQNDASILQTTTNANNYYGFYTRPHNFDVTNTDEAGGYHSGSNPNKTWMGWQASVYKSAVSVAQYVSWADVDAVGNQFMLEYDLTNSKMTPSKNANQSVRGDIWLGTSSGVDVNKMYGISFDAGTIESNKDLVDGTTKEWDIYVELFSLEGGLTVCNPIEREVIGSVGKAVWNKSSNTWVHDFNVKLELDVDFVTSGTNRNLEKIEFRVTSNDEIQKFEFISSGQEISIKELRLTYGVNYTPDIVTNNRCVPDITNGATWYGLAQVNSARYYEGEFIGTLGFLEGRQQNDARQVGIYGSDVSSVKLMNESCIFSFRY